MQQMETCHNRTDSDCSLYWQHCKHCLRHCCCCCWYYYY